MHVTPDIYFKKMYVHFMQRPLDIFSPAWVIIDKPLSIQSHSYDGVILSAWIKNNLTASSGGPYLFPISLSFPAVQSRCNDVNLTVQELIVHRPQQRKGKEGSLGIFCNTTFPTEAAALFCCLFFRLSSQFFFHRQNKLRDKIYCESNCPLWDRCPSYPIWGWPISRDIATKAAP